MSLTALDTASAARRKAEGELDDHADLCDLCSGQSLKDLLNSRTCANGRKLAHIVKYLIWREGKALSAFKPRGAERRIKNNRS